MRRLALTDQQRDIVTGIAVKAAAETIAVVFILWLIASVIAGTVVLGRWIGGLG